MGGFQHLHLIHTYERTEERYITEELSTPLGHLLSRPYSYSQYWTEAMEANAGKSFQMQIIFNIFPRIRLHFKLVPVQY